ncbi:MAG: hypothetical protein AAGG75_27145 [Bacteroidota bacterium]
MENKHLLFPIFLLQLFLLGSCTDIPETAVQQSQFFDLKQYFKEQEEALAKYKQAEKTTTINGKTETKLIDEIDFAEELAVFADSDINKASWLDRYEVDSTLNTAGQLQQLQYHALDDKLRTKSLVIDFKDGQVLHIAIENTSSNAINTSQQVLKYRADEGYSIQSRQKVVGAEERVLGVSVQIKK